MPKSSLYFRSQKQLYYWVSEILFLWKLYIRKLAPNANNCDKLIFTNHSMDLVIALLVHISSSEKKKFSVYDDLLRRLMCYWKERYTREANGLFNFCICLKNKTAFFQSVLYCHYLLDDLYKSLVFWTSHVKL